LLALGAAVYLAGKNQETRRSAYFAGARVSIVPESITGKVGAVVPVQVFITSNKITGSEELAKVSSLDATVCYGDGLRLDPNTLDDDIQLNQEAFKSVAFKKIEELSTPIDGANKCLKMVLITTGIQPDKLMSGTFRAATIRFRGAKAGSGKIIINSAIMGGYNPMPEATDTALEVGEKKGASYVISGTSVTGDVNFFPVDTQNRSVTIGQSVEGFVNFKIGTNKLSGVDFRLKYDQSKLKFESVMPVLSGAIGQYSSFCDSALFGADTDLIDKRVDEAKGTINLAGVSMEADETKMPTGRVCLVRFKFKALVNGEATVTLDSSYENSAAGYFPGQTDQGIDVGNVIPVKFTIGGGAGPTNTPPVATPTSVGPTPTAPVCGDTVINGTDKPEEIDREFEMGMTSGHFEFTWKLYAVPDRAQVYYEDELLFDITDNNNDFKTAVINFGPGTSTKIRVKVIPDADAPAWYYKVACPVSGHIEPTPFPTGTPGEASWPILKYVISFRDIASGNMCITGWPVTITAVASDGTTKIYANQIPVRDATYTDRVAYKGKVALVDFPYKDNVAIFVKGPKHLQNKYGINNQQGDYGYAGGKISMLSDEATTPVYDFTGYPLMPGDVTGSVNGVQDGVADGRDYSYIKAAATRIDEVANGGYLSTDLDGNCKVNGLDTALFKLTLKDKLEEMY